MTSIEEAAQESTEMARSTASMFQSLKIPANGTTKFAKFLKFIEENLKLIAKNDQNQMILEGKRLAGSNFDQKIRNHYVAKAD